MAAAKNIVGPRVREARNRLGWSQQKLAAKCQVAGWDISRSIVAAIEGRVRWVGDFELVLLAQVLQIPPGDLFPTRVDWANLKPNLR
ncbi:helix-turn-helix domain-containing protein [Opitutus terrae]|uniref:Transcriptional regulator, XRE family n=1 Tax=Opitutus terrae (strain DSM 11246 / JCM 15787 / PB90-1) TaxID=452637 RepID=B1ZQG1_OPITP|nr:helix-turn-helix transcriptional regulator [Opitutus terrae]ACB73640.1 transcriptional regulator, XRE family [Opitutus terrae PB90-1]